MASSYRPYQTTQKKSLACGIVAVAVSSLILMGFTATAAMETASECVGQLKAMATCLPYAQGKAKMPTPDCCSGVIQALKYNKKCLCLVLKDINDPKLAIQVNLTVSLSLPVVCKAPDNVFQCPELLHMDPKSPEAQVFNQLGGSNSRNASTNSPQSSGDGPGSQMGRASGGETTKPGSKENGGGDVRERLFGLKVLNFLIWIHFIYL